MGKIKSTMILSATKVFNPNSWNRATDKEGNEIPAVPLKDLWAAAMPGLYKQIDGDTAVVVMDVLPSGDTKLRLAVPIRNGKPIELPLSSKTLLEEGDEVSIESIVAFELVKAGAEPITRYDAEVAEA